MEDFSLKLQGELQHFWRETLCDGLQRELQRELKKAHEELLLRLNVNPAPRAASPMLNVPAPRAASPRLNVPAPRAASPRHHPSHLPPEPRPEKLVQAWERRRSSSDGHEWTHRHMKCFTEGKENTSSKEKERDEELIKSGKTFDKKKWRRAATLNLAKFGGHAKRVSIKDVRRIGIREQMREGAETDPEDAVSTDNDKSPHLKGAGDHTLEVPSKIRFASLSRNEKGLPAATSSAAIGSWVYNPQASVQIEEVAFPPGSEKPLEFHDADRIHEANAIPTASDLRLSATQDLRYEASREAWMTSKPRSPRISHLNNGDTAAGHPPPPKSQPVKMAMVDFHRDANSIYSGGCSSQMTAETEIEDIVAQAPVDAAPFLKAATSELKTSDDKANCQTHIQRLVRSTYFDTAVVALVIVNAVTIGWETDHMARNKLAEPPTYFRVIELTFCTIFTAELALRFFAWGCYLLKVSDWRWNLFDCIVVGAQLVEEIMAGMKTAIPVNLSVLRVMRAMRLVRIIRLMRILRLIGELRTIICSLAGSMKSLFWTVLVLFLLIYIVAVYFTTMVLDHTLQTADPHPDFEVFYGSLGRTLLSLYEAISGGIDWDVMIVPLMSEVHIILGVVFSLYIAFALLAMMNVVTGVFVEAALLSAKEDKDIYMVNHVREMFSNADQEGLGCITWKEFQQMLDHPEMQEYFKAIDVDLSEAHGLFRLLDINDVGALKGEEFLSGCLRLRGPAKALDLALLMQETRRIQGKLSQFNRIEQYLDIVMRAMNVQTKAGFPSNNLNDAQLMG